MKRASLALLMVVLAAGLAVRSSTAPAKQAYRSVHHGRTGPGSPISVQRLLARPRRPGALQAVPNPMVDTLAGRAPSRTPSDPSGIRPNTNSPAPTVNFDGLQGLGRFPPDSMGAAGPNHFVNTVNVHMAIYDKTAPNAIVNPPGIVTNQSFFAGAGVDLSSVSIFDPRIQYDQHSGRFIFLCVAGTSQPDSWLAIAVSQTSDPTGTWNRYILDADLNGQGGGAVQGNAWADFPTLGVDSQAIYVHFNMFTNAFAFAGTKLRILDKAPMLRGDPTTFTDLLDLQGPDNFTAFNAVPANTFGTPGVQYLVAVNTFDDLALFRLTNPLDPNPTLTVSRVTVPTLASPPNSPQPGGVADLDSGGVRMRDVTYRDGSLWTSHCVGNDFGSGVRAAARWYEIDSAGSTLVQTGLLGAADTYFSYPNITVDTQGNALICYQFSDTNTFPGFAYATRSEMDPAGTFTSPQTIITSSVNYERVFSGRNRWGDYTGISLDPATGIDIWIVGEYAIDDGGNDNWRQRIASVRTGTDTANITVTQPNGGEMWQVNSTQQIRWTTANITPPGLVDIEISRNNGLSWTPLITTANDGLVPWRVIGPTTNQALIRITSQNEPLATDTSDGAFQITPPTITVQSPDGGERFIIGDPLNISWTSAGVTGTVSIGLSRDGGPFIPIPGLQGLANIGNAVWPLLTGPPTMQARIQVQSDSFPTVLDASDADFEIAAPSVTVLAANGGETINEGALFNIRWTTEGITGNVKIELSRDDGVSWTELFADTPDDGTQPWQVTGPATQNALFRITSINDPSVFDVSDAVFNIFSPTITLLSPNGGECLFTGSPVQILWASTDLFGSVKIEFSPDGGATWQLIISSAFNDGNFTWIPGLGSVTNNALIRVSGFTFSNVVDVSDAVFAIKIPTLRVTAPNARKIRWRRQQPQQVTWTGSTLANGTVDILISFNRGRTFQILLANTPNDGVQTVTAPRRKTKKGIIRVRWIPDPTVFDDSDFKFRIRR